MPVFTYKAIGPTFKTVTGTVVADTARHVREQLADSGLSVQEVVARKSRRTGGPGIFKRRSYRGKMVEFVRDLSTLLGVGVPLVDALRTLSQQQTGGFRSVLLQLQDRVAAGASLASAMRDHPAVFDPLDINVADVGETAGTLETVLNRLADYKESSAAVRGRIGAALLYPAIVLLVAVGVSILLMTFVVPKLLNSLIEAGRPVPLVTRIVKTTSDAILGGWWIGTGGLLLISVGVGYALTTDRGRRFWDRTQLRIPLLGPALAKQSISRIALVMATLMRSGVVFIKAMEIARDSTNNSVLRDAMTRSVEAISSGSDLAAAIGSSGAFPPMVVQMFAIGQQSGRLEDMLDRLAVDYDRQVKSLTTRLTTILEPVLILFMVVLVGFIAFATLLPMLEAADMF